MKKKIRKIIDAIRTKLRAFLGLEEMFMGVDVGLNGDESCMVIASNIGSGRVKIISCKFSDMRQVESVIQEMKQRYGIRNDRIYGDFVPGIKRQARFY